jgi:hypothetical protein
MHLDPQTCKTLQIFPEIVIKKGKGAKNNSNEPSLCGLFNPIT